MFNKLGLLALAAPLVNALVLNIPSNPVSGEPVTITWTFTPGDPVFSLELTNEVFHNSFAIQNNVQPELQTITIPLPIVPAGDGYTLNAVNIGDINQSFSSTGDFSIAPNPDVTSSSTSQASTSALSTTASASVTTAQTTLVSGTSSRTVSGSVSGSTVTAPSSSATRSASNTAQTNVASTTAANGALSNYKFGGNMGAIAGALLSALAGAAIVVL